MSVRARRRFFLGGVALFIVGALVAFLFWPREDELARWKAEMRAKGENFSFTELAPPFSKDKSSFVKQLRATVDSVAMRPVPIGTLEMMHYSGPGYAHSAWQQPFPVRIGKTNVPWAALEQQMAASADALRSLRELLSNIPSGSPLDPSDPLNSGGGDLVAIQRSAKVLALAVVNDLHRGALDEALANLHALILLTRLHEEEGYLVFQMMRVGVARLAVNATWEALQASGWSEARLAALDAGWAKVELLNRMVPAFDIERAWIVALYSHARTNRGGRSQVMGGGSSGVGRLIEDRVYGPIWQKAWSKTDELLYLRAAQTVAESIRQGITNRSWQAMNARLSSGETLSLSEMTTIDRIRYPMATVGAPNRNKALKRLMLGEAEIQMARTAIAIERHRLRHGRAPDSLMQLVPEFLRELPTDYMTGRPLLYARNPDGTFALYSAGEDGHDDDGFGDDVVWQQRGAPARVKPSDGPRVPFMVISNVPSRNTLKQLAQDAGLAVGFQRDIEGGLGGRFTLELRDVTAGEALESALQRLKLFLVRGPKHHTVGIVTNPPAETAIQEPR